ncbi:MAG: hypothetical protein AB8B96_17955 [Lysobacterales bacterium]
MTRSTTASRTTTALEPLLSSSQRGDSVSDELHKKVMARVHQEQLQDSTQSAPANRWFPRQAIPALAFCAAALLLATFLLNNQTPEPAENSSTVISQPPMSVDIQPFASLLDTRLAQPLDALQSLTVVNPLQQELAALESDLDRLKPRWPWEAPPTEG